MMRPTSLPGRSKGFSLLELIVVLILLGAAAALVLPSFTGSFQSIELEAAARDLVTHLRKARTRAVSLQQVHRIILQQSFEGDAGYVLTNEYEEPIQSYTLPDGVSFSKVEESPLVYSFYPNGRSSGGRIELESESGKKLFVVIDPVTGLGKTAKTNPEGGA